MGLIPICGRESRFPTPQNSIFLESEFYKHRNEWMNGCLETCNWCRTSCVSEKEHQVQLRLNSVSTVCVMLILSPFVTTHICNDAYFAHTDHTCALNLLCTNHLFHEVAALEESETQETENQQQRDACVHVCYQMDYTLKSNAFECC